MPDSPVHSKKPTPPAPCRLYAILAREAPIAVLFRRGPSQWVQVIHWDTAADLFTPGQWFHGRLYERRGDLSPDGSRMIYFAQKINRCTMESDYTYAWTAISRPPYLTALALWPKGDCWDGGGLFLSNNKVWLNHPPGRTQAHENHRPQGLKVCANEQVYGEDAPILLRRLARDGWHLKRESSFVLRKQNPHGWQKLIMASTLSCLKPPDSYSVRYDQGKELALTGAEWADWDQRGRLVFAAAGKVYALDADAIGYAPPKELADLSGNQPQALAAPDWAQVW